MSAAFSNWPVALEAACATTTLFRRVHVLEAIASTQDAPETRDAQPGTIVTAWRQTAGRGRFGRQWADTASAGVAATFVVDTQPAERLALAGAIGAAGAAERALGRRVGIKWPNDIVVDGRKLAGVLIEVRGARTCIGIGINCTQERFDGDLESRATSLRMLGARADRLEVLVSLIAALDHALTAPDERLVDSFLERDALRGTRALFATPHGPVEGEVRSIDPMRGLVVRMASGEQFLPAASTSVAEWAIHRSAGG